MRLKLLPASPVHTHSGFWLNHQIPCRCLIECLLQFNDGFCLIIGDSVEDDATKDDHGKGKKSMRLVIFLMGDNRWLI